MTEMSLCDITAGGRASDGCTKVVILQKKDKPSPWFLKLQLR